MNTFPHSMNSLAGRRPTLKSALLLATFMVTTSLVAQSPAQAPGGKPIKRQDFYEESRVLTPGEADDWPLRTRDGETVILAVTSRAFDAAVQMVGPAGQIVAENDDARPGEQNPVLVVRLDQGGEYLVRVKSYKSAQGGQYKLTVRRFVTAETQTGLRTVGVLGK